MTDGGPGTEGGGGRHATVRVAGLIGGLLVLSGLLALGLGSVEIDSLRGIHLPWWAFALFFALTESAVLHVQSRREAQTVSISELPLVLGLFFAAPWALVLGRVVGSLIVFVIQRRSSLLKSTFNVVLITAETLVALTVFHATVGDLSAVEPRQWAAALGAVLVANAVGSVAIGLVIAVYEGGASVWALAREAVTGQAFAPGVVVLALVAVACVSESTASGWLVAAAVGVLTVVYRAYAALFDRHVNLERLYQFSQAVTDSSQSDAVLKRVLDEAKELLVSGHSRLMFASSDGVAISAQFTLDEEGGPRRTPDEAALTDDWLHRTVLTDGASVVLPRRSRVPRVRAWLAANGLRDAIAVPLRGTDRVIGMLLVGERLGEVRTYDHEDQLLLETLANHASVALQKGELIEQLQHEALHDALTGLPNRTHLQRVFAHELRASEAGSAGLAVMILDLDGFKDVNDTLGHHQGDLVLIEVAARLLSTVGDDGFVARLGGDEFAVLVPGLGSAAVAQRLSEQMVASLQKPMRLEEMQFEIGASVGVALSPQHGIDSSILMKRADMAMYDAKASGLKTCIFEVTKDTTSARRLALVSEMRTALTNGDIKVYVQPQEELSSGRVRSVEALARWEHASMGVVSPAEFIPVAERSGLIAPLTMAMLDAGLAGVAAWQHLDVSVAVNLSPRSLLDPTLVADVQEALRKWAVPPGNLVLEVTEGAVMTDPDRAIDLLHRFNAMGVRLSIDDFGTGYSSLSYLKRLPVHEVKIDRSFVTGMASSREDFAIVKSIIDLGASLGLETVAEGVEDRETFDLLRTAGCTRVQGWHVARPMPIDSAARWLDERNAALDATDPVIVPLPWAHVESPA